MNRVDDSLLTISHLAEISPDARIFPSVRGTRVVIGAYTRVMEFAVIRCVGGSGDLTIGQHCVINPHCVLYSGSGIRMADNVALAPGVMLMPANHVYARRDLLIREQGFESRGGIAIEEDVWIGANSVVLDGAQIGKGAVVAAGSVVRGIVPPYTVWGGVPARQIKER